MSPTTRSNAKDHKQHNATSSTDDTLSPIIKDHKHQSATSSVDDTTTLTTLLHAIDYLKTDLQSGLHDVKLANSDTSTEVDHKVTAISSSINTLHDYFTNDIILFHSDKVTLVYDHVDNVITSACSEWKTAITDSSLSHHNQLTTATSTITSNLLTQT
jgi:hypothetical protein